MNTRGGLFVYVTSRAGQTEFVLTCMTPGHLWETSYRFDRDATIPFGRDPKDFYRVMVDALMVSAHRHPGSCPCAKLPWEQR